jgi:hypothetical protein
LRQVLPPERGYPVQCDEVGATIHPGVPFDHDVLVAGCVPVDEDAAPGLPDPGTGDGASEAPGDVSGAHSAAESTTTGGRRAARSRE